jgi:alkyl hydroperoxide reductase subunit AhpC
MTVALALKSEISIRNWSVHFENGGTKDVRNVAMRCEECGDAIICNADVVHNGAGAAKVRSKFVIDKDALRKMK